MGGRTKGCSISTKGVRFFRTDSFRVGISYSILLAKRLYTTGNAGRNPDTMHLTQRDRPRHNIPDPREIEMSRSGVWSGTGSSYHFGRGFLFKHPDGEIFVSVGISDLAGLRRRLRSAPRRSNGGSCVAIGSERSLCAADYCAVGVVATSR